MYENISLCVIKIETNSLENEECVGATSSEHPSSARFQKERERDRGLRVSRPIIIESYSNKINALAMDGTEPQSLCAMPLSENIDTKSTPHQDNLSKCNNLREVSPLEEGHGIASELPKEITFFSGNPSVEVTHGIIHLYKKNERKEMREAPSNQLCLLAVPASLDCHDLLSFVAPCHNELQHIRIVRDGSPNQFMVLLEFRSNESAMEFYRSFNGVAYNSLEPDSLCHAVWVSSVERGNDGSPPLGHTELPTCPVCLERMDESVDGVLTILCNHAFHANCLIKWGDSTCPVCRHVQTPELMEDSVCMECEGTDSLWICLICGHVGCGRYQGGHAAAHFRATNHTFALQLGTSSVWDYAGDNFVHRLFQNKTDGKLVATQAPNDEGEEKIDSMQLEFTYLLTSQLDTQRKYYEKRMDRLEQEWIDFKAQAEASKSTINDLEQKLQTLTKEKQALERKLAQNNCKLKEVQKHLAEEKEISKALQKNQTCWHTKYSTLENQYKGYKETHEADLAAVKDELRDVMFYISAQSKIAESEMKDDLAAGSVILPRTETPQSSSSAKSNRRKKKS